MPEDPCASYNWNSSYWSQDAPSLMATADRAIAGLVILCAGAHGGHESRVHTRSTRTALDTF
jgi:hypothetical protein